MGYSYGYNRTETSEDYHTARELILMLVDIVRAAAICCSISGRRRRRAFR